MEVGRNLLFSPPLQPPRPHLTNSLSSSVPMIHEQAALVVTSISTTSIARHFPASVLLQEQWDDCRLSLPFAKEDKAPQATLDRRRMEKGMPLYEEKKNYEFDQYLKDFQHQLLYWPGFWYLLPSSCTKVNPLLSLSTESTDKVVDIQPRPVKKNGSNAVSPWDALALAKKAVMTSKEATSLAENSNTLAADLDESFFSGLGLVESSVQITTEETIVRSKRLLERRSKKRGVPKKPKLVDHEVSCLRIKELERKVNYKSLDPNDPLQLFLWGPETKQLLTQKEESELFVQVQDLMRLGEMRQRLQSQFHREPTLAEWAQAVGISSQVLNSRLNSANRSREKMIYANFRLVVHVAKQYQRKGLSIQDLLQEGSKGLMKSLEKFKPQVGCRFSTYAYWWIRQSIRRAIFHNSRTIRLPENVYGLLTKIRNAKNVCIQEGQPPTKEVLAKRVGITVEKLERLVWCTRTPISIQQSAWKEQDVTFQEVTADPEVEIPELTVAKQFMRRHVRNLLNVLTPRERQIIRFRYGIHDGERKSLAQIGVVFGLSKERVRQVESRALEKLKECLSSQGLEAYVDLLI